MQFQTDPTVRIALLGITAAGVAVTLTASSTVWFAELFWTPAIMVQAEDRCHRIGQQSNVRCLYFIAKGTLDEVLWKLIEKKFRDLGEVSDALRKLSIILFLNTNTLLIIFYSYFSSSRGKKIWESSAKKNQWDGVYNEQQIPDGVYAWLLTFDGWDDKTYQKTGTVMVLH